MPSGAEAQTDLMRAVRCCPPRICLACCEVLPTTFGAATEPLDPDPLHPAATQMSTHSGQIRRAMRSVTSNSDALRVPGRHYLQAAPTSTTTEASFVTRTVREPSGTPPAS